MPRDYTVVIDNQEKLPYKWKDVGIVVASLDTGDYSVVGYEDRIAVERKSLDDYWGCMGKRRFRDCLSRLAEIPHSCVVVEGDSIVVLADDYTHETPRRGGLTGVSRITGRVAASITRYNMARYKVPIWFAGDRERAAVFTLKFLDTSLALAKGRR